MSEEIAGVLQKILLSKKKLTELIEPKKKLTELIEQTLNRRSSQYFAFDKKHMFSPGKNHNNICFGRVRKFKKPSIIFELYSKTCLKRPLKKDKTKVLTTNGRLMQAKNFAECSPWSLMQYL